MTLDFDELVCEVAKDRLSKIERLLCGAIECHLGRVPTDAEAAKYGKRVISTDPPRMECYFWNGFLILQIVDNARGLGFTARTFSELCQ